MIKKKLKIQIILKITYIFKNKLEKTFSCEISFMQNLKIVILALLKIFKNIEHTIIFK